MDAIPEEVWPVSPSSESREACDVSRTLQTLTSGTKRDVRGGAFQAHVCVVSTCADVDHVMRAFHQADSFKSVTSWSYAYRIKSAAVPGDYPKAAVGKDGTVGTVIQEGAQDGLDEGCGERVLSVLRRSALENLLLIVTRWQDHGASAGLDVFGTSIYGIVVQQCKDLIFHLKRAMGLTDTELKTDDPTKLFDKSPPKPKRFDFSFLPPLPEPRLPGKFGPNHFLSDSNLSRPASLPHLFSGGDVRLWMANDQCLRQLPDSELWAMRFLRQPDARVERILQAVALLRGQKMAPASTPAARWGQCREILRSGTFRTELLLLDASQVPKESAQNVLDLLQGLDIEVLRRISPGAAALFEWAHGVARWRLHGPPIHSEPKQAIKLQTFQKSVPSLRHSSPELVRCSSSGPRARRASRCIAYGGRVYRKEVLPQLGIPGATH